MATRVFISYRRATGSGHALLIYDHLRRRLPDVFRDQNSLTPGERFGDQLERAIGACDAMIVVVTPGWAEAFRIRQANSEPDWVLEEIRAALAARKQIVPVLAGGATADELLEVAGLPGLATVRDFQSISLHEENYETVLDDVARLLWSWPRPRYWVSSALLLAATVMCAVWLERATAWGANWWGLVAVLLIGWLVPNGVALRWAHLSVWHASPLRPFRPWRGESSESKAERAVPPLPIS
jgi:TIR domain